MSTAKSAAAAPGPTREAAWLIAGEVVREHRLKEVETGGSTHNSTPSVQGVYVTCQPSTR